MFCSNCGNNVNGKLCSNCGNAAKKEAPSFLEFMKGKQLDRESHFKTKKRNYLKSSYNLNEEVIITAGILKNVKGEIKPVPGTHMPCKVKLKASVGEIKKSAFEKLSRYCAEFVCDDIIYCKLCCKSGEIVENIPGTNIPFTLDEYKENLLVSSYVKVILCLMVDDFSDTDLPDVFINMPSSVQTRYVFLIPMLCCQ